ncbi:hypothetical protein [Kineococcus sp. SYSU DK018]|uniref:hypothetical protein n=1 Tax=Kineococcus sp. SYSU DK018 TaxID=3383139 RepID=UPI003D7EDEE2
MRTRSILLPLCLSGALLTGLTAPAVAAAPRAVVDSDLDRMPDAWELANGLNPKSRADARADGDKDGLKNLAEFKLGTSPADEDSDDDGQDDADERSSRTKATVADTDRDGVLDGDEDYDRDGIANEDEDDARETCAGDDDDLDGDHVADEDENELGLAAGDADADNDGTPDGDEDHDRDGDLNEDEDDADRDRCNGDLDRDGRSDEDEGDVVGTITAFDAATGALSITGSSITFRVTGDTEIEVEIVATVNGQEKSENRDGRIADLVVGAEVSEVDAEDGELEEITIRIAGELPADDDEDDD